jgi:hypothetical protein
MSAPTILISPIGYDNVGVVLQRLGGSLVNTHQLEDADVLKLGDAAFLSNFQHLFLNCHSMFGQVDPAISSAVRDFVYNGGVLYASDWAGAVVEAAFGTTFSPRVVKAGMVQAKVSDPYLAYSIGRNISINFDMDQWVLIDKFLASANVYLLDTNQKPFAALAVGFRVGRGRVVFTSFHHHAQQKGLQSATEEALLQWLVTLPTQHGHLLNVGTSLAQHRATGGSHDISWISDRRVIPLNLGSKGGLGVFALSWDYNDRIEFSMRFLRRREVAEAEKKSSHPPLVMTVRNPKDEDTVEVRRHILGDSPEELSDAQPCVFAASIRRDLLGDPDWFASAIERHLLASLEGEATVQKAQEHFTTDSVQEVIETILGGLGYVSSLYREEDQEGDFTEIRAWHRGAESEVPALQIEIKVVGRVSTPREAGDPDSVQPFAHLQFYPIRGELIPGAERLLVYLAFSREGEEKLPNGEETFGVIGSSSESIIWRPVASESIVLGRGQRVVSAQEFSESHRLNVIVYRAEEGSVQN